MGVTLSAVPTFLVGTKSQPEADLRLRRMSLWLKPLTEKGAVRKLGAVQSSTPFAQNAHCAQTDCFEVGKLVVLLS